MNNDLIKTSIKTKIKKIKKRDGRIVKFNPDKIATAIWKAAKAVGGKDKEKPKELAEQVVRLLEKKLKPRQIPVVEQVQDLVEKVLVENGHYKTAKAYILYRQKRTEARKACAILGVKDDLKLPLNTIVILAARYLLRDEERNIIETTNQLFRRVAKTIAEVEKKYRKSNKKIKELEEKFYQMMTNFEFLPNSPTLMNAGTKKGLTLSACFVIPIEDDMESIFEAVKTMALVQKAGGGTGFSFTKLRPAGDVVKSTGGTASGPISFMKVFDAATEQIKQGGKRRGANMGILRVDHPDILDFIVCKEVEGVLRNFNISVGVTDKFMRAVENDGYIDLINPRNGKSVKRIKARAIWNLIATMAWKNGEPGIIFLDTINKHNPTPHVGKIEATNPCVTGDTFVFTKEGWIKANKLRKGMEIWSSNGWSFIDKVIDNGIQDVFKVELKNGMEIEVTKDHKFLTPNGWKCVAELTPKDKVKIVYNMPENYGICFDEDRAEWLGYWVGDGSVSISNHVNLFVGSDDILANHFLSLTQQIAGRCSLIKRENQLVLDVHKKEFAEWVRNVNEIKIASKSEEKKVPSLILRAYPKAQRRFLRGIFSADGSVYDANGTPTISLSSCSKKLLQEIQLMLLSQGIPSTLTKEHKKQRKRIKGKVYTTLPTYRLLINGWRTFEFYKKIGLRGKKLRKLEKLLKGKKFYSKNYEYVEIKKIKQVGKKRVFDIKAPPTFTWVTNGLLSLDCGEQPLLPYESCNLGSINLSKFVEDGKIDWERLKETVRLAVRFLDNVIDANVYPIKEIDEMTKANRKIGLGVMGFADMLIKLQIPYNSEEALKTAEKVMRFITTEARKMSEELGKEKGNFPNFKGSVWDKRGYKYMRNATVTTIAPTGTISEIAGCSQGIEPLFAIAYMRNVKESLGYDLTVINPLFENISIMEGFYSEELIKRIASGLSIQHIKEIPEKWRKIFVTAMDIDPEWHVRMQAAFQKYTDNSVSKTVNLPNHATPNDVEKIFMLAWKLGCKGITVYRFGSRKVQVINPATGPVRCEACEW